MFQGTRFAISMIKQATPGVDVHREDGEDGNAGLRYDQALERRRRRRRERGPVKSEGLANHKRKLLAVSLWILALAAGAGLGWYAVEHTSAVNFKTGQFAFLAFAAVCALGFAVLGAMVWPSGRR